MAASPDDEFDLGISLVAVATIVEHARAVQEPEEAERSDEDEDSDDADDMPEDTLRAVITELNEDEQASLIALAWIGRGDYESAEWEEARALAAERNAGRDASDYLLGMDGLGDLLEEGVAAFGLSLDDVDV